MADRPRKRRWPWVLGVLLALGATAAWWIDRQLEPTRLATLVLARLGEATGLQLRFDGTPDYALRPEPRLVLPGFDAREPGAAAPMLRADRIEVSLPWATVWGEGPRVVTRIQLQAPVLDLQALSRWSSSRPAGEPFELPTLTEGLQVRDGRLLSSGWAVEALSLDLPELRPGAPARLTFGGRYAQDATRVEFSGQADADSAGLDTDLRLQAAGRITTDTRDLPWTLALAGRLQGSGTPGQIRFDSLSWTSQSPLPDLAGAGHLAWAEPMDLRFEGELPRWPETWAALPEPIAGSSSPLQLSLQYQGAHDLSDPLRLRLQRDEATLALELVPSALQAWLDADGTSPLPPLQGELQAPRLVVDGIELEGVRLRIAPDDADADAEADVADEPR